MCIPALARLASWFGSFPFEHLREPISKSVGQRLRIPQQLGGDHVQSYPIVKIPFAGKNPVSQCLIGSVLSKFNSHRRPRKADTLSAWLYLAQVHIGQQLANNPLGVFEGGAFGTRVAFPPFPDRFNLPFSHDDVPLALACLQVVYAFE